MDMGIVGLERRIVCNGAFKKQQAACKRARVCYWHGISFYLRVLHGMAYFFSFLSLFPFLFSYLTGYPQLSLFFPLFLFLICYLITGVLS